MHKVFLGTACFLFSALSLHAQSPLEKGLQSINRTSAEAIVEFLADDELQGREAGMHGSRVAARYIVSCLKEAGIRPLDKNGYYQPFEAYNKERQKKGRFRGIRQGKAATRTLAGTPRLRCRTETRHAPFPENG